MFREFEVGLKADQVVKTARQIILPELDDRIRTFAGAWIVESHRAHGTEGQRVHSAFGDDLDRQAALEEVTGFHAAFDRLFKGTQFDAFGRAGARRRRRSIPPS